MRKATGIERLYIDFDGFFATAEQHLQPRLRGMPVGIVPVDSEHTGLIAASREAKAFGVKRGAFVREARRLCPGIALMVARHDVYVRLHHAILAAIERVVPVAAVRSIDEMVCALLPAEGGRGVAIAREVKAALARDIGPVLTCSIGLGPNELLAKIAAEMRKPDGLAVIRPEDLPGILLDLPLRDIPGIAAGNAARLERAGIIDMAGLWRIAPKQARAIWGNVEGERLWALLHGYAVERPSTVRSMFGHGRVLPRDWRDWKHAQACARFLAVKAARRMRREGFAARALAIWLTDRGTAGWYGERAFPPTFDDRSLLASLGLLFASARAGDAPERSRSVHVTLHGLVPIVDIARDLFETTAEFERRRRWERLTLLSDRLGERYGRAVVHVGPSVEPPGGYAGAKIAFNRIPDLRDF